MSEQLVITALGEDRPGLVNELSNKLTGFKLNIEDSRMSMLGGEFAIILLISGAAASIEKFSRSVSELESALNMKLLVKKTISKPAQEALIPYQVEVVSIDHPGIVQEIASFFSVRDINIVDMKTTCYRAAHTGTPMFALKMTIGVPVSLPISVFRENFIQVCDEKNLDVKLEPTGQRL
jgi:glycine cleavage system transcriptional repressor